jgi:hypothetical protein
MKVTGTGGMGPASGPRQTRPAGGEGFSLAKPASAAGPGQASTVGAAAGVMGVQALIALQESGGPLERRRRAVGRAGRILDVLDEVKVALLDGNLSAHDLERLRRAVREERAATDDPKLEGLLGEIETRAAVEMAKLERATSGL